MRRLLILSLLSLGILTLPTDLCWAGGLFLPGHGVRGFGRAGAFTAGGDDPGGIWYNPATMGGREGLDVLVDGSLIFFKMDYARVDSGGNPLSMVSNEGPLLPIPTIALSTDVIKDKLWLGGSLSAPYAPLPAYPKPNYGSCTPAAPSRCLDTAHGDAPQRYSLISLDGTLFLQLDLALAYRLLPNILVGISVQNLFANFVSLSSITSYNGALSSGPEDPDFDSLSQMKMQDLLNPSLKMGLIYEFHPRVKLGVSFQLPFWVGGDAKVNVQLPVSPVYEASSVEGSSAEVNMTFPLAIRTGLQVLPLDGLRLEIGLDWEQWSALQSIKIKPKDIYILNIPSIDRYKVPELAIALNFQDTLAMRLGVEYTFPRFPLVIRGGYIFERGAVEDLYASVLAMDASKHVLTVGASYSLFGYRLDLLLARSLSMDRTVDYRSSQSLQVNPINPTGAVGVGGGSYSGGFTVIGLGVDKVF